MINKFLVVGALTATAAAGLALAGPASAGDVVGVTSIKIPSTWSKEAGHENVVFRNVKFGCHVNAKIKNKSGKVLVKAADLIDSPSATRRVALRLNINGQAGAKNVPFGNHTVVARITGCGALNQTKTAKILVVGN